MKYFIAPRSGEKTHRNFESTIKHGVPLDRIRRFLTPEGVRLLSDREVIYAWGNREGTRSQWERMSPGDTVIFYAKGHLVLSGKVYFKQHSKDLALAMWPPDENGNPWEYTFYIEDLEYIDIPMRVFNQIADYKPKFVIQGFTPLKGDHLKKIENEYGSVETLLKLFQTNRSNEMLDPSEIVYVNVKEPTKFLVHDSSDITPPIEKPQSISRHEPRKINYLKRAKTNALTGSKGEAHVVIFERNRLVSEGRSDLASKVEQVSASDDTLGYDVLSFDKNGEPRYIEVKSSARKTNEILFYLSSNELLESENLPNYYLYLVENVNSSTPSITQVFKPFTQNKFKITPMTYLVMGTRK